MAVFTPVSADDLEVWLRNYSIGTLLDLQAIASGIENTNYFVDTTHGRFVLTLFEKLSARELPFYLNLMAHLSSHGIPCPRPIADLDNCFLGELKGKPAGLVSRLPGQAQSRPEVVHCAQVGKMLAHMHLAGKSYPATIENPRGPHWWALTAPKVMRFLSLEEQALLQEEMRFQASHRAAHLPRGVVHADLFRDNVLFSDTDIGGVIDFYFAGADAWLFDLAITVNDWCMLPSAQLEAEKTRALLSRYNEIRPVTATERVEWPVMLRAAALRFWLSRLDDFHLPREGHLIHPHDPYQFKRILHSHVRSSPSWPLD
jgi:homoserine kinase type II